MQPELQALVRLQAIDDEIAAIRKELKEIPSRIESENAYLNSFNEAVHESESGLAAMQKRQRDAESEIQSAEARLRETRGKQAQVKTNEEYRALTHEIEAHQKKIGDLEERVLECMEGLEPLRSEVAEAKKGLEEAQKRVQMSVSQHKDRQARLEDQLGKSERERQSAWETVSSDWQSRYKMLYKGRGGAAVVPIIDRTCQGCRMSETIQRFFEIRDAPEEIYSCSNCGRIVYYKEAESVETVPPDEESA